MSALDKSLDRRIKALGKLGRTRAGRRIIKDHGAAICSLMVDGAHSDARKAGEE